MVAILSMHRRGTSPISDRNPVLVTRNGIDIMTADMMDSPISIIFSFLIMLAM
jgi:hypothetical protein